MLGIERIASYVPDGRRGNLELAEKFGVDAEFLRNKLGVLERARRAPGENTSDLARVAFIRLLQDAQIDAKAIDALIVVTQSPDFPIPHVSAMLHGN